jgi:type III secretion system needle length determinant
LFKDFAAMAAQMDALATSTPQSAEVQAKPAAGLDAVNLNELVSRILVNTPDNGKAEVRLTLQDNVLRGTEISITRDTDGLLTVRITTDNAASFQTLVASRNDLQAILQQQEGRMVNVQMLDESQREQNDSRRRSKGLREDEEEKDD